MFTKWIDIMNKITIENIHEIISPDAEAALILYCVTNDIEYNDEFISHISMYWPRPSPEFHLVYDKGLTTEVTIAKFGKTLNRN